MSNKSNVIFIGDSPTTSERLSKAFFVTPTDVFSRIFIAFMPPVTNKFRKVSLDLQGPIIAIFLLTALVNYAYSFKKKTLFWSPTEAICGYAILLPVLSFILCHLSSSYITFYEITCLLGYSLYGHFATLLISFLCFEERSNFLFFLYLVFFCGLSTFRLAVIILWTIKVPAARLLVCSIICVAHILFLIFLHFAYMHRTFSYSF